MAVSKALNPPKNKLGVMGQNPRVKKVETGRQSLVLTGRSANG